MPLYRNESITLEPIREEEFKLEKDIQSLIEKNLEVLLSLEMVASEFKVQNFRIDTLAYDKAAQAFVIIEYKKDKNFSVIDQGYAYLSLMLNNKGEFIVEYNENKEEALKRNEIDWSQSRVIFISPLFTTYQKQSLNFKDIPIEIFEIKKFSNNTISFAKIVSSNSQVSINTLSTQTEEIKTVTEQVKVIVEDDHLKNKNDNILEIYNRIKSEVLNLDSIIVEPKKEYVAFKGATNIIDVRVQKNSIKLWINLKKGELVDPQNLARDVLGIGHWGNGDYELTITDDSNFDYILSLIKQSIKKNRK